MPPTRNLSSFGVDLLQSLLDPNVTNRLSAQCVLQHEWFQSVGCKKDTKSD